MPRNPNCTDCPLHTGAKTVCMWGRESGSARFPSDPIPPAFVVGEAPGAQEDAEGKPFVGPSGQMLRAALDKAGLAGYYLTNAAKCRPPGNKLPPASVKACAPYLDDEIATRKPAAILAVGATAWKRLGGTGGVTENAGKEIWSDKYQCWVMPVLHPASLLHTGTMNRLPEWELSVARYGHLLRGSLPKKPPVLVSRVGNPNELDALLDDLAGLEGDPHGFTYDFETTHFPWWHRESKPLSIAFSYGENMAVAVPILHPQSWLLGQPGALAGFWGRLIPITRNRKIRKTAHNMLFDDLVFHRKTNVLPHTTLDTMVAWHLLNENSPKGLKFLERLLLGWPDTTKDTKNLEAEPLDEVLEYNGLDAAGTYLIRRRILDDLKQDRRLAAYLSRHLMPGMRTLARIIATGIHVDRATTDALVKRLHDDIFLRKAALPVENPGSTQQLSKWLYEDLKLPVLGLTDGGAPSTDEETLNRLALQEPRVREVLAYRGAVKNLTTYVIPVERDANESFDGRLHPDYHIGPETGRLGSRFHTEPRDRAIRGRYTAPSGTVLLCADQKQVEARLVAWHAAGCPTAITPWAVLDRANLLRAFLLSDSGEGPDPYRVMAGAFRGKDPYHVTDLERQDYGKVPVLASLYRISAEGLREYAWKVGQIVLSKADAYRLWTTFKQTFPEVGVWHDRMAQVITARGWVQSAVGRKRRLPDALSGDGKQIHKAVNSGINMPVQCHQYGTPVLTDDLRWVPVESLRPGRVLLGFEEDRTGKHGQRHWRPAVVETAEPDRADCFEIVLDNGDTFVVTGEHLHLTENVAGFKRWLKTTQLKTATSNRPSRLVRLVKSSSDTVTDWERGYIAGMFDADGCLSFLQSSKHEKGKSKRLTLAQLDNAALDAVLSILNKAGFRVAVRLVDRKKPGQNPCNVVEILGGGGEILRFLTTFQPPRLLTKIRAGISRLGSIQTVEAPRVMSITPVGIRPIIRLKTSTSTYLANGYATHNSLAWDITWAGLQAMHDCGCGVGLVGTVHDSAMMQVEDAPELLRLAALHMCRHMEIDAVERLRPLGLTIPHGILKVDLAVGRWGSKQGVEAYIAERHGDPADGPPISRLLAAP